jgi:hypothetical protein
MSYKNFDQRFTVPQDTVKSFGCDLTNVVHSDRLSFYQEIAKNMINKNLAELLTEERLSMAKKDPSPNRIRELVLSHFNGILHNRPDIRIALSLLDEEQVVRDILVPWLKTLKLNAKIERQLLEDLSSSFRDTMIKEGDNLIVGKVIGGGGSGTLFEGTFEGKPVVIKRLYVGFAGLGYGNIITECLRQSELHYNPHIPKLIGIKVKPSEDEVDQLLIIMEKVDGNDYSFLMHKKFPLDEKIPLEQQLDNIIKRAKISIHCLSGIAKGLEALHQRDLVHCDVKSENVLFDKNTLEPRLIDFGTCARKGDKLGDGTAITISPEVAQYSNPEPASDVYALGCVMYQQITGNPASLYGAPYPNSNLFTSPIWDEPLLRECKRFIEACLEIDPNKRPTTKQILQAIRGDNVTPGEGTSSVPGINDTSILDIFLPEKGHAFEAKHILAEKFKTT